MNRQFWRNYEIGRVFVQNAIEELAPELETIFDELNIRPVWIGAIAVGIITEPILTFDIDILISQEDFLILKREGKQFEVRYAGAGNFRYKDKKLECIVEGERMDDYIVPPPDAIREKGFMPSIEGLFLLKLMRISAKDREHLARLYDFRNPNEKKLQRLIFTCGDEKLWQRYLRLKSFWEV